ncbi:hypothetical protein SNEBB_008429 [Seison nebaliae]|nr:hypothetical protein SNEBB_008429 [Seison nebaliae]
MAYVEYLGCFLLVWSFPFWISFFFMFRHPIQMMLMVVGNFTSLFPLLVTALFWYITQSLQNIYMLPLIFSLVSLESCRLTTHYLFNRFGHVFSSHIEAVELIAHDNLRILIASSTNFGFALTILSVSTLDTLSVLYGHGSIGIKGNRTVYFGFINSYLGLCFFFINFLGGTCVCLSLDKIYYDELTHKNRIFSWITIVLLTVLHLLASTLTHLNVKRTNMATVAVSSVVALIDLLVFVFLTHRLSKEMRERIVNYLTYLQENME